MNGVLDYNKECCMSKCDGDKTKEDAKERKCIESQHSQKKCNGGEGKEAVKERIDS
jgi:hypothetical protein